MRVERARRKLQNPDAPFSWLDPRIDIAHGQTDKRITTVLAEVRRWEKMPNRREPLTTDMITYQQLQREDNKPHSEAAALYDWEVVGIYTGNRLSEWAQHHGTTDLSMIIQNIDGTAKAFIVEDIEFYGKDRRRMSRNQALARPYLVETIDITWRFQKNGNNGEKKTIVRLPDRPGLCPVSAVIRIVQRWQALHLSLDHPLAVFTDNGLATGVVHFITEKHINHALQTAARMVYNITKKDELARFTSHSIRVGACVSLHAADLSTLNIQHALRWRSNSFWNYLRNLPCQAQRTARAVVSFNPTRLDIAPVASAA